MSHIPTGTQPGFFPDDQFATANLPKSLQRLGTATSGIANSP
jgi:hypothetical protein